MASAAKDDVFSKPFLILAAIVLYLCLVPWWRQPAPTSVPKPARWNLYAELSPAPSLRIDQEEGGEKLTVDYDRDVVGESWQVQLNGPTVSVAAGVQFALVFRGRAERPRSLTVAVTQAHEPWENLGLYAECALTPAWQSFRLPFVGKADDGNARVQFLLGSESGGVELASIDLLFDPWTLVARNGAEARLVGSERVGAVRVQIDKAPGGSPYDVQLFREAPRVEADREYVVELTARADKARTIHVSVGQSRAPYANLGLDRPVEVGPDWKTLQVRFKATSSESSVGLYLNLGSAPPSIEISEAVLKPASNPSAAKKSAESAGPENPTR